MRKQSCAHCITEADTLLAKVAPARLFCFLHSKISEITAWKLLPIYLHLFEFTTVKNGPMALTFDYEHTRIARLAVSAYGQLS